MRVHQIQKAGTATELSSRSDPLCSDTGGWTELTESPAPAEGLNGGSG